jgi:hypothetical protein
MHAKRSSFWLHVSAAMVLTIACFAVAPTAAWAAKGKAKQEEPVAAKDYIMSYFVVGALMGIGLMTLCRPGKREEKVEITRDDED